MALTYVGYRAPMKIRLDATTNLHHLTTLFAEFWRCAAQKSRSRRIGTVRIKRRQPNLCLSMRNSIYAAITIYEKLWVITPSKRLWVTGMGNLWGLARVFSGNQLGGRLNLWVRGIMGIGSDGFGGSRLYHAS